MGVPVITSRWNGAHDLWPADPDGWLVEDPSDVGAVARAMRAALDPARREAAAVVGRSVALAIRSSGTSRGSRRSTPRRYGLGASRDADRRDVSSAASASSTARWTVVTSIARMYRPSPSVR